mmetsp:Transcript_16341/g.24734  ORF Transcript_16341/g.24734 Transcript_16341/m.24734 type:complete len:311 (-) Transcript_16341:92-1024(-)|eukprot:CAMPEP_0178927150 /NCGR_PEP_ID=MMETSP0786-20121207/19003_1 /TAXON_ID=186022 /ORGANISM="Thalassionema frauenfeldii, Strain CCMP 1798" /LENGTH=310 /DNA_ID=CAMNT_0020602501 /DNA_START=12 /DNA_END=944 /DNA_ORIENTATION=-
MTKALLLALLPFVSAIDIALKSFDCDVDLPVYATSFDMSCGDEKRCTFGETATFSGILEYNGTGDAGVSEDGKVYSKAGLQLMTLDYELLDNFPLYMCGPWVAQLEENDQVAYGYNNRRLADAADDDAAAADDDYEWDGCTVDGTYAFFVDYDLPYSGEKMSWLATGWKGVGNVRLFSESGNSESLIGYCTLNFNTYVTPSGDDTPIYYQFIPNSQISSYILGGFIIFILLLIFYCTCCTCCHKKKENKTPYDNEMDQYRRQEKLQSNIQSNIQSNPHAGTAFDPIANSRTNSDLEKDDKGEALINGTLT